MAHEIYTNRNGVASMAFVGATPWHGLGQQLTEGAPIETWAEQAGFQWSALSAPVGFTRADGSTATYGDKQVIYRSDTGAPLSVMGDGYKIVQPMECLEFFRDLAGSGGWNIHTAGILKGGRLMWAMARNCAQGDVVPGDTVKSNLLLVTSLDGTTPTTGALVATRVVCANTVAMALDEVTTRRKDGRRDVKAGAPVARVSHRSTFDASAMKETLGVAPAVFDAFMTQARTLAGRPCDLEMARAVLRDIFGQPLIKKSALVDTSADVAGALLSRLGAKPVAPSVAAMLASGAAREQKSVARCLELFNGAGRGADHEGVKGTAWGLLNAVTEHIDHEQGRTADSRLHSAWFGRGDQFKRDALDTLLTV